MLICSDRFNDRLCAEWQVEPVRPCRHKMDFIWLNSTGTSHNRCIANSLLAVETPYITASMIFLNYPNPDSGSNKPCFGLILWLFQEAYRIFCMAGRRARTPQKYFEKPRRRRWRPCSRVWSCRTGIWTNSAHPASSSADISPVQP